MESGRDKVAGVSCPANLRQKIGGAELADNNFIVSTQPVDIKPTIQGSIAYKPGRANYQRQTVDNCGVFESVRPIYLCFSTIRPGCFKPQHCGNQGDRN